jgi:signal transduction histidine kinase
MREVDSKRATASSAQRTSKKEILNRRATPPDNVAIPLKRNGEQLRSDASIIGRIARHIQKSVRSDQTITAVLNELCADFKPAHMQLALHEVSTGHIHVWQRNTSDDGRDTSLVRREINFSYRDQLFFGDNDACLLGTQVAGADRIFQVRGFKTGKTGNEQPFTFTSILFPDRFRSFICVPLVFGNEWEVRIFLWEPGVQRLNRRTVMAAAKACHRLGPAIFAAALQEYVSSRGAAEERARFARELHDGIMQSLAAVDLRMTAVAEQLDQELPERGKDLVSIQQTIRGEVSKLRELIRRNRLTEIAPARLLSVNTVVPKMWLCGSIRATANIFW